MNGLPVEVGAQGAGTLQITDGGTLVLSEGGLGLDIGNGAHGTGTVTIGTNSHLTGSICSGPGTCDQAVLGMGLGRDGNSTVRLEVLPGGAAEFGVGKIGRKAPITGPRNS